MAVEDKGLERSDTALLMMDAQRGIVERYAGGPEAMEPFARALSAARSRNIPVIFIRVAFRDGYPEISRENKAFSSIQNRGDMRLSDNSTRIHESVAPREGEPIVTKLRVSAFSGSDLELLLRSMGIGSLILSGIATSGVVLSTLREAADKDYRLTVLSDACLDADPEVHRVLMGKVFPRQADILTVAEWSARS
jgi:nicotinamidase-related amidase